MCIHRLRLRLFGPFIYDSFRQDGIWEISDDTIIHNADCLEFAAHTLGTDIILYGTDYPFDMGNLGPAREVPGISRLTSADQEKIYSENAMTLSKL